MAYIVIIPSGENVKTSMLYVISNRGPIGFSLEDIINLEEGIKEGKLELKHSKGGLALAMMGINPSYLSLSKPPLWLVASMGDANRAVIDGEYNKLFSQINNPSRKQSISIDDGLLEIKDNGNIIREKFIFFDEQINNLNIHKHVYNYVDNGILWPTFHMISDKINQSEFFPIPQRFHGDYTNYLKVNEIFAEEIEALRPGKEDIVWIQDYHLMSVAKYLDHLLKGFFLHIPFPKLSVVKELDRREGNNGLGLESLLETLAGDMAKNGFIGMHTEENCDRLCEFLEKIGYRINISDGGLYTAGKSNKICTIK
ncbi:trehalose-6-phosphate synthase, partial [Candidatus Woesearchaeota archaeon]|nr:trehalose-6-phosphate synthase [Candidatus Woesearchaeota archaeon]